ncbi:MAG: tRNA (adenosine(37)-N6)-threonylcarbamoyltransferase complex dimerization subunit type 1 TsaB [Pseudomonadota bacterium]
MIVLGIDTGGGACSVAIARDHETVAQESLVLRHGHGQHLPPMIERVLDKAELTASSIDLIGVTIGPGAFTGLRVGLAAAGGLALATGAGIVGVSSLCAVAAMCTPIEDGAKRTVVIDSRRKEPFVQTFDGSGSANGPPDWQQPDAIIAALVGRPVHLAGDGAAIIAAMLDWPFLSLEATGSIDPSVVCRLAIADSKSAQTDPPPPAYLRPPDVKLPNRSSASTVPGNDGK